MTYDRILVPTDGSDGATDAARRALSFARAFDAVVRLLYVVDVRQYTSIGAGFDDGTGATQRGHLRREGDRAIRRVRGLPAAEGVSVETEVRRGVPPGVIVKYADEDAADLIAMGTRGLTGVERFLVGSTAERVVRLAPAPVLTVGPRAPESTDCDDVLVATDGSDDAEAAVEHALAVAERFDATIHAVSVVDLRSLLTANEGPVVGRGGALDPHRAPASETVESVAERARERGLRALTATPEGVPAASVLDYADERGVDLIAIGTHGRTGLRRYLIGSVAETVMRHADAPVLTVRGGASAGATSDGAR